MSDGGQIRSRGRPVSGRPPVCYWRRDLSFAHEATFSSFISLSGSPRTILLWARSSCIQASPTIAQTKIVMTSALIASPN